MRSPYVWVVLALAAMPLSLQAQARAPRAKDGHPDLSGVWLAESAKPEELARLIPGSVNGVGEEPPSKYFLNIFADFKPEDVPLTASAAAAFRERAAHFETVSPLSHCQPEGAPMADLAPAPMKFVQTPGLILILYEREMTFRQIHMDGRKPSDDLKPAWFGYSAGHWDGDTLVVDSAGFNDRGWLDARAHTHSDALRLTERFHRRDYGHLETQITVDDPNTYTRPFTIKVGHVLLPRGDLIEYYCSENEKDLRHFTEK